MASSSTPKIYVFKCAAALAKGVCVKAGADDDHVVVCSAATDKIIGITQVATTTAEDPVEVALVGGGAKALAGGTIAMGDLLTSDSNGALIATTTANNRVIAVAMQAAVANDILGVEVVVSNV